MPRIGIVMTMFTIWRGRFSENDLQISQAVAF